ncbi:MAG: glycosyltransferase, partial [Firmicutes bacterium]|nr:glycosyltransferase [Bacillota bacterium]
MKQPKLPTLTVAIPAYNEEANIKNILLSVLAQKKSNFKLRKIIVYSDASGDKTDKIVRSVKNPVVKLIRGASRKGKYFRVNQLFGMCESDILIILDADIALVGEHFLETLVDAMDADKNAVMIAAHQTPVRPDNFTGKFLVNRSRAFDIEVKTKCPFQTAF